MDSKEKCILLIEDNQDDEMLVLLAFKENNISNTVIVKRDGKAALDYFVGADSCLGRDGGVMPALVLLDLSLPKVDGLEVLRRLRADERTRLLPVVVLTSSKEEQDMIGAYSLGANSYIRKPVSFEKLTEVVRMLGAYWLVLNEAPPMGDYADN